jgi:hypothetical protein
MTFSDHHQTVRQLPCITVDRTQEREMAARQVIDPATWDRAAWFSGMGERAAELIADGAGADTLAQFEAFANQWLANQGVPDPPFSVLAELGPKSVD